MRVGFPVVLSRGTTCDIVFVEPSVGGSNPETDVPFTADEHRRFGYANVREHSARLLPPVHMPRLDVFTAYRAGKFVTASALDTLRRKAEFAGHSAQLALLLMTWAKLYDPRPVWSSCGPIWATGEVTYETLTGLYLRLVDQDDFDRKLQEFAADHNQSRVFICPEANVRNLSTHSERLRYVRLQELEHDDRVLMVPDRRKTVVLCPPNALGRLLTTCFYLPDAEVPTASGSLRRKELSSGSPLPAQTDSGIGAPHARTENKPTALNLTQDPGQPSALGHLEPLLKSVSNLLVNGQGSTDSAQPVDALEVLGCFVGQLNTALRTTFGVEDRLDLGAALTTSREGFSDSVGEELARPFDHTFRCLDAVGEWIDERLFAEDTKDTSGEPLSATGFSHELNNTLGQVCEATRDICRILETRHGSERAATFVRTLRKREVEWKRELDARSLGRILARIQAKAPETLGLVIEYSKSALGFVADTVGSLTAEQQIFVHTRRLQEQCGTGRDDHLVRLAQTVANTPSLRPLVEPIVGWISERTGRPFVATYLNADCRLFDVLRITIAEGDLDSYEVINAEVILKDGSARPIDAIRSAKPSYFRVGPRDTSLSVRLGRVLECLQNLRMSRISDINYWPSVLLQLRVPESLAWTHFAAVTPAGYFRPLRELFLAVVRSRLDRDYNATMDNRVKNPLQKQKNERHSVYLGEDAAADDLGRSLCAFVHEIWMNGERRNVSAAISQCVGRQLHLAAFGLTAVDLKKIFGRKPFLLADATLKKLNDLENERGCSTELSIFWNDGKYNYQLVSPDSPWLSSR